MTRDFHAAQPANALRYAVVAFPILEGGVRIEDVRRRFDPLASLLAAHVTVVFPFAEETIVADLVKHVADVAAATPAFDITLADVSVEPDGYIMLNVGAGATSFEELHGRLYTGMLAAHRSTSHAYRPHVTVARVAEPRQLAPTVDVVSRALSRPGSGRIIELAIFRLDGETGSVVATCPLGPGLARMAPRL